MTESARTATSDGHAAGAGNTTSLADHPVLEPNILTGLHVLQADAGTGKTWTVSRLVVRAIVERNLDITQIAVLTFTNAAAAELRDRIGQLLDRWSQGEADQSDPFWQAWWPTVQGQQGVEKLRLARLQLDDAPIGTIHSFCQRVLADHALSIGRWDHPEPGPGNDDAIEAAVAQWWRENITAGSAQLAALVGDAGLSVDRLMNILGPALRDPDARIAMRGTDSSAAGFDPQGFPAQLDRDVDALRTAWTAERQAYLDWLTGPGFDLNRTTYKPETVVELASELDQFFAQYPASLNQAPRMLRFLDRAQVQRSFKKGTDPAILDRFTMFGLASVLLNRLREREDLSAVVANQVRDLIAQWARQFQQRRGVIGFDDMVQQTREALHHDAVGNALADALRHRYPLAFVDEFQDTDPAQWDIFSAIYCAPGQTHTGGAVSGCGLILVGDPKQSIYSFRHADIHTYLAAARAAESRHRLGQNHRSNGMLIDAVNAVFDRPDAFALPDIQMAATAHGVMAVNPQSQPVDDGLGALSVVQLDDPGSASAEAVPVLAQRAAATAAIEIRRLLTSGAASGADIAVLVPARDLGQMVYRSLLSEGVGGVQISRDSVFAASEAMDLFRIVSAINAPGNADLVRGALTTQLIGLDISALQQGVDDPEQWQNWLQAFSTARARWAADGPQAALRDLLFAGFGRAAAIACLDRGERRLTNLLHLLSLLDADPLAVTGAAQAQSWLGRQIRSVRREETAEQAQLRLESDENLVSILTIHAAKGLEFDYVFLPFAWRTTSFRVKPVSHFYDPASACRWVTDNHRSLWDGTNPHAVQFGRAEPFVQFQESIRLMYVALTRAVRRCYVFWGNPKSTAKLPSALAWLLDHSLALSDNPLEDHKRNDMRADATAVADRWQQLSGALAGVTVNPAQRLRQMADAAVAPASAASPTGAATGGGDNRDGGDVPPGAHAVRGTLRLGRLDHTVQPAFANRSFTSLTRHTSDEINRPDHDETQGGGLVQRDGTLHASADLHPAALAFPRGANPGSCLHDILEHTDFVQAVDQQRVQRELKRYAIEAAHEPVTDWLNKVLATRLPAGFALNDVARADSLREMAYTLSVQVSTPGDISDAIADHYGVPRLTPVPWEGFLNGFIDLLVRHDNRYWLIDWKSNWLGDTRAHYDQASLQAAMVEHAYTLQMSLYTVAVHRMLRHRVSDYQYDTHFGGVCYLFMRGMTGDPADRGAGVYQERLPGSLVSALDNILGCAA